MTVHISIYAKFLAAFLFGNLTCYLIFNYPHIYNLNVVTSSNQGFESNSIDFHELEKWSHSISSLTTEDTTRTNRLLKPNPTTLAEARDRFYNIMNMPLQSVCTVGKFFGGKWLAHCGAFDGNKYVCLDYFYGDVKSGNCLIYSFGVAGDWTFEEAMAGLGCTVRAFDPTIDGKQKPQNDLISFKKLGLAANNGDIAGIGPVMTLKDIVESMGDSGRTISYLKVDIEGSEIKAIPEWISSGILDHVSQFGIELHTGSGLGKDPLPNLLELIDSIRQLHQIGFKLISNVNNDCVGKTNDFEGKYLSLMEAVFYKPS